MNKPSPFQPFSKTTLVHSYALQVVFSHIITQQNSLKKITRNCKNSFCIFMFKSCLKKSTCGHARAQKYTKTEIDMI